MVSMGIDHSNPYVHSTTVLCDDTFDACTMYDLRMRTYISKRGMAENRARSTWPIKKKTTHESDNQSASPPSGDGGPCDSGEHARPRVYRRQGERQISLR